MHIVKSATLSALLLGAATFAAADCTYPTKPDHVPDGATATRDEMIAASKQVRQFDADVRAYQQCLADEKNAQLQALGADAGKEAIQRINDIEIQKSNNAAGESQALADAFNAQLRVFKARP